MSTVLDVPSQVTEPAEPVKAEGSQIQELLPAKFLTFGIGGLEYGIDIMQVQEIRRYESPTPIAGAPAFIKGVVNLRGEIVTVVDLRLRLDCQDSECNELAVVIVLNVRGRVIGAVVDSVVEVLALSAKNIGPAPDLSSTENPHPILGIGCVKCGARERMLILIDITGLVGGPGADNTEPAAH